VRLTIEDVRGDGAFPIIAFREVADRTAAEALRGYVLLVGSNQLPELDEDEFYPFDLIGLAVRDQTGLRRGRVIDAVESPAHALLVVQMEEPGVAEPGLGREVLVPFVYEAVPTVDMSGGYLVVGAAFLE
jgi:16S rRNA processing protein RimM